jgi:ASC-1-like (ASCH) protein
MLLFVKQRFVDQIVAGSKTFEIRFGTRYRNIRTGDTLSLNGKVQVVVTHVDVYNREAILAARLISESDLADCYGTVSGPFYVFHFKPPKATF